MLKDKKIGLFITGGIAAYKMAELARNFIKAGAQVRVCMTKGAQEFIPPLTLQVLTKSKVLVDTFDEGTPEFVQHVEMADWCDLAVIAPASANIMAKMAHGIADDIVSTTLLATTCPKLVVPAMNVNMYGNVATQRNIMQLQEDGLYVMDPEVGFLAEGYEGKGRLPELGRIKDMVEMVIAQDTYPQLLAGKKVLVTAGGTIERIDPVRYISNDSSGKMGYTMARTASWLGADVQLISTTHQLQEPTDCQVHYVRSARQMFDKVVELYEECDYVVMAAAVSDYYVTSQSDQKIKKQVGQTGLVLNLQENPDILAHLGKTKRKQILIGFAAETENLMKYATDKLTRKNADWIIANNVAKEGSGFNFDTNQVTLISRQGNQYPLDQLSKIESALLSWETILSEKESLLKNV